MGKICCDMMIADMKLRIFSDCELPLQSNLKEFYAEFDEADIVYNAVNVSNPDDFIPKTAKEIYVGACLRVFELDGCVYHRYSYGGELSVLRIDDEKTVYVSADELSPVNIQKSLALETEILGFDGAFIHASLIKVGEKGIIFTAPSGVGKSTQATLWEKYRGARILNGDRAAVRFVDGKWMAYGSPWAGSSGIYVNDCVELSAIVFLGQSQENVVRRLNGVKAFSALMKGGIFPYWNKEKMNLACNISEKLLAQVPVFEFDCRPDESAVNELEKFI